MVNVSFAQAPRVENTIKIGTVFNIIIDPQLIVDNKTTLTSARNNSPLMGIDFFFERITNNYFGFEARVGYYQQQIVMKIDSVNSTIQNNVIYFGGSMRAYLRSHRRRGFNIYGALNPGFLYNNLKFQVSPPGALKSSSYNFFTLVIGIEGGVDYLLRFAGLRASFGGHFGASSALGRSGDLYKLRYDINSVYFKIGVFSFF